MSDKLIWNILATKEAVFKLYGKSQMLMVAQSLDSVVQRRDFAHFHYHEAMDRWKIHLDDLKNEHPIEIVFRSDNEDVDDERAGRMHEVAAHVHACIHSLHTIPDIMAHAVYYGIGLNLPTALRERDITAKKVARILMPDLALSKLSNIFQSIYTFGDFAYIDALNNHGKHRSIIRPATWFDLTGKTSIPITLEFSEFNYSGAVYRRREIQEVINSEYDRIAKAIVDCGIELLAVLQERLVKCPESAS